MSLFDLTRRSLLKAGAAGLAASALPFSIARAQAAVTLGIVYVGPKDDFGWNQAHAVAAEALKRSAPECRYIVTDDTGHVVTAGRVPLGADAGFHIDLAGRLPEGRFTLAAQVIVNDNAMNAEIQRIAIEIAPKKS